MTNQNEQLVLHRVGDETAPIEITQDKCLLRSRLEGRLVDSCAIFVGPYGTALRSYVENVRVNGEVATAQWLNAGDQIVLPCNTTIEVRNAIAAKFDVPGAIPVEVQDESPAAEMLLQAQVPAVAEANPPTVTETGVAEDSSAQRVASLSTVFANLGIADPTENVEQATTQTAAAQPETEPAPTGVDQGEESVQQQQEVPAVGADQVEDKKEQLEALFGTTSDSASSDDVGDDAQAIEPQTPVASPAVETSTENSNAAAFSELEALFGTQTEPEQSAQEPQETTEGSKLSELEAVFAGQTAAAPTQAEDAQDEPQDAESILKDLESRLEMLAAAQNSDETTDLSEETTALTTGNESEPAAPVESEQAASVESEQAVSVQTWESPDADTEAALAVESDNETEEQPEEPKQEPVGVADILGKMGFEIPADDEDTNQSAAINDTPPAGSLSPAASVAAAPVVASTSVESSSSTGEQTGAEADIQAYMNRLLNRDPEPAKPETTTVEEETTTPQANASPLVQEVKPEENPQPLTPEEFKPKVKPKRVESFDALREIANESSRNAIQRSVKKTRQTSFQIKTALFAASVIGSVLFFLFGLKFAMLGFACAAFATSYVFYQDHLKETMATRGISRDAAGIDAAISGE